MESLGNQIKSRLDYLIQVDKDPRDQQDCTHFIVESLKYLTPKQCNQLKVIGDHSVHKEFLLGMLEVNKGIPDNVKKMVQQVLANGT